MNRSALATSVVACLPADVLEQLLEIWEAQLDRHVEMEFHHGRCLEFKVTTRQQFSNADFTLEPLDSVGDQP